MRRYLVLYAYLLRFSFSKAMEFRLDFVFRIAMDIIYYAVNLTFFKLLYLHAGTLGGWTEPQAMVFVAGYLVVDAINMTLFANNMWMLPQLVNRGDLDYYLVRPVSSLFFVSVRDFAASSFVNLLMTAGIMAWALARYPEPIAVGRLLLYALFLLNGSFVYYCMRMYFVLPVFWTHSARGFDQLFWSLGHFMEKPDRIWSGWLRKALTFILPFTLMASFPARVFFEGPALEPIATMLGVSAALFGLLLLYWRKALAAYSSASS
jgi:ABC-2 type transport system permease protein